MEKTQREKFEEAAKKLETDDDESRFDDRISRIAKSSPPKIGEKIKERPAN